MAYALPYRLGRTPMPNNIEVICIGEVLVDAIPVNTGGYSEGMRLELHFGGAPANVAIGIARLGPRPAFAGAIGSDPLGEMLRKFLEDNGVDTRWLVTKNARTSLAFVVLREHGEREFFFYREPWVRTADTMLAVDDLDIEGMLVSRVVHASGVATSYPPLSEAVFKLMSEAFERGIITSFDPNYRADIWGLGQDALMSMEKYLRLTRLLTIGLDELRNMFGFEDHRSAAEAILNTYGNIDIVAIRLGSKGAYVATRRGDEVYVPAYKVGVVDTTGAGDAWTATFIAMYLLENRSLATSVAYANAAAAIKCTRRGAASAFPKREELEEFVRSRDNKYLHTSAGC